MIDLPEGWTTTDLESVIQSYQSGFASGKKDVEGGIPHLRMNNIGVNCGIVLDLLRTVPPSLAKPTYSLTKGDILICTTNSSKLVGKCAVFDLKGRFAFSNHLTRLRPRPGVVVGDYLARYLWLLWQKGEFEDKCKHWVNQSTIPKEKLLSTPIVLPPINEQRRIVAKLEALLAKVEACQKRLAKIPVILKRFRQSVLAAACSGRLTVDWRELHTASSQLSFEGEAVKIGVNIEAPDAWHWTTLGSLCEESRGICYGVIKLGPEVPNGIPCLRTSDVKPLGIDVNGVKRISPEVSADYKRTLLRGGEVLVNVRGTLGGVAVVPPEINGWNISREVALVPLDSSVDAHYISFWVAAGHSQSWLSDVEKGVAYTGINLEDLRLLPVAVPSLVEQREIVRRVRTLFTFADQLEDRYKAAKAQVDKLTQSIFAKAFRGELVPTEAELVHQEGPRI